MSDGWWKKALAGAGSGGAVGSAAGPWGTAAGTAVGFVGGLLSDLFGADADEKQPMPETAKQYMPFAPPASAPRQQFAAPQYLPGGTAQVTPDMHRQAIRNLRKKYGGLG